MIHLLVIVCKKLMFVGDGDVCLIMSYIAYNP